jgi:hypothetical protein
MHLKDRATRESWNDSSSRLAIRGFELRFVERNDVELLGSKLDAAIALVQDYDPATFDKLRIAMPRILVANTPGTLARYHRQQEICEIRADYLRHQSTTAAYVAMALVHEGMHARVHARRLANKGLTLIREERLAARAELTLAERLPAAAELVEYARKRIRDVDVVYSPDGRLRADLVAAFQMGAPLWLVKLIARYRRVDLPTDLLVDPYSSGPSASRGRRQKDLIRHPLR